VSDHPRDCPHGRQWGKCDTCDLATAHERIIGLVDENKQLQAERDYAALEYKREHALRLEIEAEAERLRDVVDAALLMRSACPMDWTHGDCRDSQCAVVCCALAALDEEATDEPR
jgi:hypothetical protein